MIIIDTALKKREAEGCPIRVGLIGAGAMGKGVANLIANTLPGMRLSAIFNRHPERALGAYAEVRVEGAAEVSTLQDLEAGIDAEKPMVTGDHNLICEAGNIDVLIDATGSVEFGAQLAMKAFECKKDVVSMNVELDATVGSIVQHYARKASVMYTIADGDQPSVEMNLLRFVKSIGVEPLVCGNIKGLQDHYRNPTTQKAFAEQSGHSPYLVTSFADGSKISMEQACIANASGMQVEMRGMRGGDHEGHVDELCQNGRYDVDKLRELGGVVDYVVKAQPSPGIFVFGTCDDPMHQHHLKLYKLGDGPLYSFYRPYHLCYFEVPLSVGRVVCFRDHVLEALRPMVDVITIAKRDLKAGEIIDAIGGYTMYGQCENYPVVRRSNLLPQGVAEGCVLTRDIPKDTAISYDDVIVPEGLLSIELRAEQDALFPVL